MCRRHGKEGIIKMKRKQRNGKSYKRIICALTAVSITAASAVMLSGCGKNDDTASNNGQVTVSIANWPTKEPGLTTANQKKEKFEAENPGITIVPDTWSFDLQTFYPKAAAGLLPNQFNAFYTEINNLINTGYLADITDVTKEMGIYDKLNPTVRDLVSRDGKLYAQD